MARINFFTEDVQFTLATPRKISSWIVLCSKKEKRIITNLNYIFCSDSYLKEINIQYLGHNTFTDIITFDQSDNKTIEGDIYISIERVKENAEKFEVDFLDELHRVMIHGALHLMGYKDKTKHEKGLMRQKEDTYLAYRR